MQSNPNPPNEPPPPGVKAEPPFKADPGFKAAAGPTAAPAAKATPGRTRGPLLAGGLLAGAALAIAAVFVMRPDTAASTAVKEPSKSSAGKADVAVRPIAAEPCRINPIVKAAESGDGSMAHGSTEAGAALIVKGKEAAAAGRDRDAEGAFLAACNLEAAQQDSAAAIVRADAKYNLARHYASLAQEGVANRGEMNSRAAILFGHSLDVYRARLGPSHEKAKFATQALATLQDRDGEALRRKEQFASVSRPSAVVPEAVARAPAPVVGIAPAARPAPAATPAPPVAPRAVTPVPAPVETRVAKSAPPPAARPAEKLAPREQPKQATVQVAKSSVKQVPPPVPRQVAIQTPRPVKRDAQRDAAIAMASGSAQRSVPIPVPALVPVPEVAPQRNSPEPRFYPQPAPGAERYVTRGEPRYEPRYEPRRDYPAEASIRPSFDCSRARSQPEKIICADPQLARMDRDLGRVYARAKRAADDPRAFQRVSDREWRRREAECRDRECLVEWYRQRHDQLSAQADYDRR